MRAVGGAVALILAAASLVLVSQPASAQVPGDFRVTNFSATILNNGVRFTWGPPSRNAHRVAGYRIEWDDDSGFGADATYEATDSATQHEVREGAGTQIWARVAILHSQERVIGPWSYVLTATGNKPADRVAPAVPAAPTVVARDTQLRVAWARPAHNGCTISSYRLQHRRAGTTDAWTQTNGAWKITRNHGSALRYDISGLTNGVTYEVGVQALSPCGSSAFGASATGTPVAPGDFDIDDNGLIDVDSLAKLDAIRYDLDGNGVADRTSSNAAYAAGFPNPIANMGCPAWGCTGYELTTDLDFDTGTAGDRTDDDYYNGGDGWAPIAGEQNIGASTGFRATFEGNDYTISNLFISRAWESRDEQWDGYRVGLFGATGAATIRNLNLTGVNVTGSEEVGGLAGITLGTIDDVHVTGNVSGDVIDVGGVVGGILRGSILNSGFDGTVGGTADHTGGVVGAATGATIRHSYAKGSVTVTSGNAWNIGGLAGSNGGGTIAASYAANAVTASDSIWVGGLVGQNGGQYLRGKGTILSSYSSGTVTARNEVGGLVGLNYGTVSASYSTGALHRNRPGPVGGVVGWNAWINHEQRYATINNSYFNSSTTGWVFGAGHPDDANRNNSVDTGETNTVPGYPAVDLTTPTGYTSLFAEWNTDIDGDSTNDNPWCFGSASDFPSLRVAEHSGACPAAGTQGAQGFQAQRSVSGQDDGAGGASGKGAADKQQVEPPAYDAVPSKFSAAILNSGVRFTWAAPTSGGTPAAYELRWDTEADLDNGVTVTTVVPGDARRLRVDARPPGGRGVTVWAEVRAQDAATDAWGPWSYVLKGTGNRAPDRVAPATPDALALTAGNGALTVSWTAPADNGCSIIRYWVRYRAVGANRWTEKRNAWKIDSGSELSYAIANLTGGKQYQVQVRADGLCGRSGWSASATGAP